MLFRLSKYAVKNILRNKFLSVSTILVLTLLMFFINILVVLHNISFNLIDSINSKLTISLYLKNDYSEKSYDVKTMMKEIEDFSSGINIDYKNKFEVLEELKEKDPDLVRIIEGDNPLPDTINLSNIKLVEYEGLNNIIESKMYLLSTSNTSSELISSYKHQYERIMKVIIILKTLQVGLYFMISIFLLAISIIVYSIIGNFVYHYRDEIYITRLVGGSDSFIYGPFTIQGMVYSFLSFLFSITIFVILLNNIGFLFPQGYFNLKFLIESYYIVFLLEFGIFLLLGGLSGYLSAKKYLN